MILSDICNITSNKYRQKINENLIIFTPLHKKDMTVENINLFDYKIIINFKKNILINIKIGIGMNMKNILVKFKNYEYIIYDIENIQFKVDKNDFIEFELNEIKNYFEIYLKFDNPLIITNNILKNKIIIITSSIIISIGKYFKLIFESYGYECEIKLKININDCLDSTINELYIILYNNENHLLLPKRFIYYQIEQKNNIIFSNLKLFKKIIYMIKKAEKVWEFSDILSDKYKIFCKNKLYLTPMPFTVNNFNKLLINYEDCEYDIFFFGHKNERRSRILNELLKYFKIKIGWKYYDKKKIKYIIKSKIILNIHFYNESALETCRINEILNYNKIIISEKSLLDNFNMELYKDLVFFIDEISDDLSNINNLINIIKYYLNYNTYNNAMENYLKKKYILESKIKQCIIANI